MAGSRGKKPKHRAPERKPPARAGQAADALTQWAGPLLLSLCLGSLTIWSWRKWPDPLVDFGRELYVAWQLGVGRVLYRDIASPYGPFSPYLNALFFKSFGTSLTVLIICNLLILIALIAVLYRLLARLCDRLTATVACSFVLCVFAFSQYVATGNYNFITPYSHEATHSIVLSVAMIYALYRYMVSRDMRAAGLAGVCLGLILLTKAEVAFAAIVAVVFWSVLRVGFPRAATTRRRSGLIPFAAGVLLPQAAFFLYFMIHMTAAQSVRALLGCWIPAFQTAMTGSSFYAVGAGLDEPLARVLSMARVAAKSGLFLGAAAVLDVWFSRRTRPSPFIPFLSGAAVFVALIFLSGSIGWQEIGTPLPVLSLVVAAATLFMFIRNRTDEGAAARYATLSTLAVFSLALLPKMILNTRLYHYGFHLAMPAALTGVWTLVWFVPGILSRKAGGGAMFRAFALAAIAACVVFHLQWSDRAYRLKTYDVGRGADAMTTYSDALTPMGPAINEALDVIGRETTPTDTVVVMPEGVTLNYLARRANPTPYLNFLPPEMQMYGEGTVLASLKTGKPSVIVLVPRNVDEFGVGPFGSDERYGKAILSWINQEYSEIRPAEAEASQNGNDVRIAILKRNAVASAR